MLLRTGDSNQIKIGNSSIKSSLCEKFHDVEFDTRLTFDRKFEIYVKKSNVKLKALATAAPYIGLSKKTTNEFLFCWTIQLLKPISMNHSCIHYSRVIHLHKHVFSWYKVILFLWRTNGKRMGHFPFTIKTLIWNA